MTEDEPDEPPEVRVFRPPPEEGGGEPEPEEPTDVKFVGPETAECLAAASIDPLDIPDKEVSYRMLLDAGVNPGTAAQLRREHSLPWTRQPSPGTDLDERSRQVRGLREDEATWVAESSEEWEFREPAEGATEADGSGSAEAAEAAWRDRSRPDPVTDVDGIGEAREEKLARAGITSVRSLSTADPELVADVLDLPVERVEEWVAAAREAN